MMKKKWNVFGNYCIPKGKNEGHIIGTYVSRFVYVNDNGKVTLDALQIMHNMLCYPNHVFSFNPKKKIKEEFNISL